LFSADCGIVFFVVGLLTVFAKALWLLCDIFDLFVIALRMFWDNSCISFAIAQPFSLVIILLRCQAA